MPHNRPVAQPPPSAPPPITGRLTLLMAVTVGLLVANLHYLPPLLSVIAGDLGLTEAQVGSAATLGIVAQTVAMLLVLPLGDIYDRRRLVLFSVGASVVALLIVAAAGGLIWLSVAIIVVGLSTTGTHMTVSLAASLSPPSRRGHVVGIVISGLLVGILVARIFAGVAGAHLGWRAVYICAAVVLMLLFVLLWRVLPATTPDARIPYPRLLTSMWTLWRNEPTLREACFFGAMTFGAFSAFWLNLVFHLESLPGQYGSQAAGLMGLFALAGALAAAGAGRLADHFGARPTSGVFLVVTCASFALLWLLDDSIWGLGLGVVIMDLGIQGVHVCNQTRVYALNATARNRLGALYMVTYFAGGSLGSALSIIAWTRLGWGGVCLVGAALTALAVARLALGPLAVAPSTLPRTQTASS